MCAVMLTKPNRIQEMSWYLYRQSHLNLLTIPIYNQNDHISFNIRIHYKFFKERYFQQIPAPFLLLDTIMKLKGKNDEKEYAPSELNH